MAASDDGADTRWEGYSDYQRVSIRLGRSIDEALDAYAELDSRHQEQAQIPPEVAADARKKLLAAALRLIPELEEEQDVGDAPYQDILDRWQGRDQPGYIKRLNEIRLQDECPGWLFEFAKDLRTAGWHLGYLKAGRVAEEEPEDPTRRQVQQMLD